MSVRHAVAYIGRSRWLVNGKEGDWNSSYRYLTRVCGLRHSATNHLLANALRMDRARWADVAAENRVVIPPHVDLVCDPCLRLRSECGCPPS